MKLLIWSAIVLSLSAIAAVTAGHMLPSTRSGRAERMIAAEPDAIRAVVTDVEGQTHWRADIRSIDSDGATWTETTRSGERIHFAWQRGYDDEIRLIFASERGYRGEWRASLSAVPDGTMMLIEERTTIANPLSRLIARMLFDPGAFARRYLDELAVRMEGTR